MPGLREVLATLHKAGFDARWAVLAARDDGAPHKRKRMFILAKRRDAEDGGQAEDGLPPTQPTEGWWRHRAEPSVHARFVAGKPGAGNPDQARCALLGNAVVPSTVAAAMSWLLTGDVRLPAAPVGPRAAAAWRAGPDLRRARREARGWKERELPLHGSMVGTDVVPAPIASPRRSCSGWPACQGG